MQYEVAGRYSQWVNIETSKKSMFIIVKVDITHRLKRHSR